MQPVGIVVDLLVGADLVRPADQGAADDNVAEGDDVGDDGGRDRRQEQVEVGHAEGDRQVVEHLAEGRLGKAELDVGKRELLGDPADRHGDDHRRDHAVFAHLVGQGVFLRQRLEGDREDHDDADQPADGQGDRRLAHPTGRLEFAEQRGHPGADEDASLERSGDQPHDAPTPAGDAEDEEDQKDLQLQGDQRLDRLGPRLELAEVQQHHRNPRGDPARHHRNPEQRRQHEADAADEDVRQGDVVGQPEILLQKWDHRQGDDEQEQRLDELDHLPAVMNERQPDLERAAGPIGLFLTFFTLINLHYLSPLSWKVLKTNRY